MTVLSLQEAAERTETSKVDIWRAIQAGRLLAQRTNDGGFAIDPAELKRVFAPQEADQSPAREEAAASGVSEPREPGETPEKNATSDIAVAFAELQDQLMGLLGPRAEVRANDEARQGKDEQRVAELAPRRRMLVA